MHKLRVKLRNATIYPPLDDQFSNLQIFKSTKHYSTQKKRMIYLPDEVISNKGVSRKAPAKPGL